MAWSQTSSLARCWGWCVRVVRETWERCAGCARSTEISSGSAWRCKAPKVARLLKEQKKAPVPLRTLQRFIAEELGRGAKGRSTVRVVDPPPGQVLEVDFGLLGYFVEMGTGRRRKMHALFCTASRSRHMFVWPCLSETQEDVIEGLEAAWQFFGGVFRVLLPDNLRAVVAKSNILAPRISESFLEYAQARGFVIDPARVRKPRDKARVERTVRYGRDDFFKGEKFGALEETREAARRWSLEVAGLRTHGTTKRQPLRHFEEEERPLLLPVPEEPYDRPLWSDVTVGRDGFIAVAEALYSVPQGHRGAALRVRTDRATVKLYQAGRLITVHPRVGRGQMQVDAADLPAGSAELAMRDGAALQRKAEKLSPCIGEYAERLLDNPRPWTRMRHVYRLLGLARRYGAALLDEACAQALALDVVDVTRIDRMLERGLPGRGHDPKPPAAPMAQVVPLRFLRAPNTYQARTPAPSDEPGEPHAPT